MYGYVSETVLDDCVIDCAYLSSTTSRPVLSVLVGVKLHTSATTGV